MSKMVLPTTEIRRLEREELTQGDIEYFQSRYGDKFVRAFKAAEDGKVTVYHFHPSGTTTWIVSGRKRQYLIIPDVYCTCRSFYQDVVISRETNMCYHLLAQKIAQLRNLHDVCESTDAERRQLYVEWRRTD